MINAGNEARLYFGDGDNIQRVWQTTAVLQAPDEEGYVNFFRIFLTATTKEAIQEFIAYQLAKESPGLRIRIKRLAELPQEIQQMERPPLRVGDGIPFLEDAAAGELTLGDGKLRLGISRLYMSTPGPYKISYEVDPPVSGTVERSRSLEVGFNIARTFGVGCTVNLGGEVNVYLQEKITGGWLTRASRANLTNATTFADVDASGSGVWRVLVTGVAPASNVTVLYERFSA